MDFSWFRNIFSRGSGIADRPRRRIVLTVVLSVAVLIVGGVFSWIRSRQPAPAGPTESAPVIVTTSPSDPAPDSTPTDPAADPTPAVQATPTLEAGTTAPYKSENFRVGDIAVGGDMTLSVSDANPAPLAIGSVRGEAFTATGKNGSKLVITWETNKPARSEISYGKGIGQAEAVIDESQYGTTHSVIIPDVTPASTYVYVISVKDKWGGVAQSNPYAVYTGAKVVSLFELIAGAVGDVFGWAVKKS